MKNSTKRNRLKLVEPAAPRPESGKTECFLPVGYRDGDDTFAMTVEDDAHAFVGLYEGDTAVCYATPDVTPGDIAVVMIGDEHWLGKYRAAPGGYFTFDRGEGAERFGPGTALLVGRTCHYERRGEIIRHLRPIR